MRSQRVRVQIGILAVVLSLALAVSWPGLGTAAPSATPYIVGLTDQTARATAVADVIAAYPCMSASHPWASPPPGWSPVLASDASLRCYGLPPWPREPLALRRWIYVMSHITRLWPFVKAEG